MKTKRILFVILGVVIVFIGILISFYYMVWAITGSHGVTWFQMSPGIMTGAVIAALGFFLTKYKSKR